MWAGRECLAVNLSSGPAFNWVEAVSLRVLSLSLLFASSWALVTPASSRAHEFNQPVVTVTLSNREPGRHPTLQTVIQLDAGATFDQVTVVSPPGSGIASDEDIPDGTIVGRLDGEAMTNAIVRPSCDVLSTFAVAIREATTNLASPDYPAYLSELAPGKHRLRLVADVSPSAEVPVLINYLSDIEPATGSVVSHIIVGNPLAPPQQFRTCTPVKSTTTVFGTTPQGTSLLTNADPIPEPQQPFEYTFTSRPDDDGHRHSQAISVLAREEEVLTEPIVELPPPPANLRLTLLGSTGRLEWDYDAPADQFEIDVTLTDAAGSNAAYPTFVSGDVREFEFGEQFVPRCGGPLIRYSVQAYRADVFSLVEEIGPFSGCVEGPDNPPPDVIRAPNAGTGSRGATLPVGVLVGLALAGATAIATGIVTRRRRSR